MQATFCLPWGLWVTSPTASQELKIKIVVSERSESCPRRLTGIGDHRRGE